MIAVGGFALSRGMTLEGLMTTYFYRRSLMYDTLMQMGRWFGYRDGYEDLCRVWMSEDAQGWYEHITEAIDLLRVELRHMEAAGAAPKDFGLKVRSHPAALLITARNKTRHRAPTVTYAVGLGNSMVETTALSRAPSAIDANMAAATRLVEETAYRERRPNRRIAARAFCSAMYRTNRFFASFATSRTTSSRI